MKQEDLPEIRRGTRPAQASQLIRPSVRILAHTKTTRDATATKVAVQVACVDSALRLIEIPRIPEAIAKMVTCIC